MGCSCQSVDRSSLQCVLERDRTRQDNDSPTIFVNQKEDDHLGLAGCGSMRPFPHERLRNSWHPQRALIDTEACLVGFSARTMHVSLRKGRTDRKVIRFNP